MRIVWRGFSAAVVLALIAVGGAAAQDAPSGPVAGSRGRSLADSGVDSHSERAASPSTLRDGAGYSEELYRPSISFRAGGTVNQHLRLGGEALAWINEENRRVESLTSLLFIGQFYPVATTGLYLKGGLGLGRNAVDFDEGGGVGDTGFAGLIGAGWELRVGRRWYLNPSVDVVGHRYTGAWQRALSRTVGQLRARHPLPERPLSALRRGSRAAGGDRDEKFEYSDIGGRLARSRWARSGCGSDLRLPSASGEGVDLAILGGNGQTGTVGQALPDPLEVRVAADGVPIQGHQVAFVVHRRRRAGRLEPDTAVTGSDGRATARWVLGPEAGAVRGRGPPRGDRACAASQRRLRGVRPGRRTGHAQGRQPGESAREDRAGRWRTLPRFESWTGSATRCRASP